MPKSKLQNIIFTIVMAFVMVYGMVCYNIAIDMGGLSNSVFLLAFHEMPIMWPVAAVLEFFVVEKLSKKLAFRFISPNDKPIFIILSISTMIVCLMCPTMSLIATLLFANAGNEFVAVWLQKLAFNFPMALFWQVFFAGPFVRNLFGLLEKNIDKKEVKSRNDIEIETSES